MRHASQFLVVWTLVSLLAYGIQGTPIFVSSSAPEGGQGGLNDPYTSIKEALASTTTESIELVLFPGVYSGANNTGLSLENLEVYLSSYAVYNQSVITEEVRFDCTDSESDIVFHTALRGALTLNGVLVQSCRTVIAYQRTPSTTQSASYHVTVQACRFLDLTGDALVLSSLKSLTLVDSTLEDSAGLWARVIGVGSESEVSVTRSTSTRSGGFLLMNVLLTMEDVQIVEMVDRALFINPATGVSSQLTRFRVSGASVNTSTVDGVAVYAEGLSLENNLALMVFEDCLFEDLEAQRGVVWLGSMSATLTNTSFVRTTAKQGGGIFLSTASITMSNSTFDGDSAVYGGGVYLQQESRLILRPGCLFPNTTATGMGNAIYCNDRNDETTIAEEDVDEYLTSLQGNIRCTVNGGYHGPDDAPPAGNDNDTDVSWTFYVMIGVFAVCGIILLALAVLVWKYRHQLLEDGRPAHSEEEIGDDLENGTEEELSVLDTLDDFAQLSQNATISN